MARRSKNPDPTGQLSREDQYDLKIAKSRMSEPMGLPIEVLAARYGYKINGRTLRAGEAQNQPVLRRLKACP